MIFLLNVKSRIRRSAEGDFIIKCGFSLENVPPSPFENEAAIVNSRYWSTEAHQTNLFYDYIYFNSREGILERVIILVWLVVHGILIEFYLSV